MRMLIDQSIVWGVGVLFLLTRDGLLLEEAEVERNVDELRDDIALMVSGTSVPAKVQGIGAV